MKKKSLYQCANAHVTTDGQGVCCTKGHPFGKGVNTLRVARGDPLELSVCQGCLDYDEMGPPILKSERGWVKK